jgi:hypothetical protein
MVDFNPSAAAFVGVVVLLSTILPWTFFCLSLQKSLTLTRSAHDVSPGLVWLLFIPVFSFGWQFYIINNVTKGIKDTLRKYEIEDQSCGWGMGLTVCILACCTMIPIVNWLAIPAYITCLIIYWVQLAGYNRKINDLTIGIKYSKNKQSNPIPIRQPGMTDADYALLLEEHIRVISFNKRE